MPDVGIRISMLQGDFSILLDPNFDLLVIDLQPVRNCMEFSLSLSQHPLLFSLCCTIEMRFSLDTLQGRKERRLRERDEALGNPSMSKDEHGDRKRAHGEHTDSNCDGMISMTSSPDDLLLQVDK